MSRLSSTFHALCVQMRKIYCVIVTVRSKCERIGLPYDVCSLCWRALRFTTFAPSSTPCARSYTRTNRRTRGSPRRAPPSLQTLVSVSASRCVHGPAGGWRCMNVGVGACLRSSPVFFVVAKSLCASSERVEKPTRDTALRVVYVHVAFRLSMPFLHSTRLHQFQVSAFHS